MKKWLILFCHFIAIFSYSQEYSFLNFSIENGLPQSQISSFTQDKDGYLWIGTMGGLAQYNGKEFTTYTIKDQLLSNRITSLDFQNDSLLIGHEGGISIRHQQHFSTIRFDKQNTNALVSKIIHFKNTLLIFTNGNGYFTYQNGKLEQHSLHTADLNRIRAVVQFNKHIYIATREGILRSADAQNFTLIEATKGLNLSGLDVYDEKRIVFTTFNGEIGLLEINNQQINYLPINEDVYGLRNCIVTHQKEIWIPHLEGIIHVTPKFQIEYMNKKIGLNYENINTVFEDRNQTIWIGTEGKGIYQFSGNHIRIFRFANESKSGIILSTIETEHHYLYGTYDGELIFQNKENLQSKVIKINSGAIWSLFKLNNHDFLLGTQEGLYLYRSTNQQLTPILFQNQFLGKITTIQAVNQKIWIGSDLGLALYENQAIKNLYATSELATIRSIIPFQQKLYIGSDNGLFEFEKNTFHQAFNFKNKINSLFIDAHKKIWIGTDEGLFLLKKSTIIQVPISKHAASDMINFINADSEHIIIGTNDGIYYTSDENPIKFTHIGLKEGISNLETNINSSYVNQDGKLLFGTATGVNQLDIQQFEKQNIIQPPSVLLKNIRINFIPLQEDQTSIKTSYNKEGIISSIELPYNKNNILIDIDGISLNNFASTSYQYRIIGMEDEWSPQFANNQINLTNLPHGSYEIQIRAINNQNMTSPVIHLKIIISPPLYLTPWFLLLAILLFILAIYLFISLRLNRIHQKNQQFKIAMEGKLSQLEQQSLNASMNRHFIFNSLNSIQYYINTQDRYSANKYLTDFAKLIRKNLDASSAQQNVVLLSDEIERLKLYLSLELMRFKDRFTYEVDDSEVITEHYHVPPMLFQPFVENSIIHGILPNQEKKGFIQIIIQDFRTHLEIKIKDNGIGINQSQENKINQVHSHISKGVELTNKRIELLKEMYGEGFELVGPYQTKDENGLISGTTVLIKIPKQNLVD